MQIDPSVAAEIREWPAGEWIESVDVATERRQQALLAAARPIGDTASLRACAGIPRPFQRSSGAVQRDEAASGVIRHNVDSITIGLTWKRPAIWPSRGRTAKRPESADVRAVNLGQRRVSSLFRPSTVGRPVVGALMDGARHAARGRLSDEHAHHRRERYDNDEQPASHFGSVMSTRDRQAVPSELCV